MSEDFVNDQIMDNIVNEQIKEQLYDQVCDMSVNELYNWLNKYDKDKLDSLQKNYV